MAAVLLLLLARPGPLSYSCCAAAAAAGTSGSDLLWLPRCCWRVRAHSLLVAVLLLARPGPLSYGCPAAAGALGSTLLHLRRRCWRVRVHCLTITDHSDGTMVGSISGTQKGPHFGPCFPHVLLPPRLLQAPLLKQGLLLASYGVRLLWQCIAVVSEFVHAWCQKAGPAEVGYDSFPPYSSNKNTPPSSPEKSRLWFVSRLGGQQIITYFSAKKKV